MSDEKIDHAALIAEARGYQSFAFDAEETGYALIIRALADALEAVQQAPAVKSKPKRVKPIRYRDYHEPDIEPAPDFMVTDRATSAVQQAPVEGAGSCARDNVQDDAPAVDREALARFIREDAAYNFAIVMSGAEASDLAADIVWYSGILQDAAEVEARGLEKAAEKFHWVPNVLVASQHEAEEWLRARAQQVREGN